MISIVTNLAIRIHGKEGAKLTTPIDFMPDWSGDRKEDEIPEVQSMEDMKKILTEIAKVQNEKQIKDNKLPIKKQTKKG